MIIDMIFGSFVMSAIFEPKSNIVLNCRFAGT